MRKWSLSLIILTEIFFPKRHISTSWAISWLKVEESRSWHVCIFLYYIFVQLFLKNSLGTWLCDIIYSWLIELFWLSRLGLQNTPTAFLQWGKTPQTNVLDMTLNNLKVKLRYSWVLGKCDVPLHCHRFLVHSDPKWHHVIGFYLLVK